MLAVQPGTRLWVFPDGCGGKAKLIRFGAQGADTARRGRKSESAADKAKRSAFKKRHAKNIAKGKRSPAWWANKFKW